MKKAQGISLHTIVIAALALLVLIVIVMIFTNKIGVDEEYDKIKQEPKPECVNNDGCSYAFLCVDNKCIYRDYVCENVGKLDYNLTNPYCYGIGVDFCRCSDKIIIEEGRQIKKNNSIQIIPGKYNYTNQISFRLELIMKKEWGE